MKVIKIAIVYWFKCVYYEFNINPGAANETECNDSASVKKKLRKTRFELLLRDYEVMLIKYCFYFSYDITVLIFLT